MHTTRTHIHLYPNLHNNLKHTTMYHYKNSKRTSITRNESYTGESIEQKMVRITQNKEPIKDGAPLVYTPRKDGVRPEHNIRTDRWEIALEAMDKVTAAHLARREQWIESLNKKPDDKSKDGGAEPIQGTGADSATQ